MRAPKLWNSLPVVIRSSEWVSVFKSRLKTCIDVLLIFCDVFLCEYYGFDLFFASSYIVFSSS